MGNQNQSRGEPSRLNGSYYCAGATGLPPSRVGVMFHCRAGREILQEPGGERALAAVGSLAVIDMVRTTA